MEASGCWGNCRSPVRTPSRVSVVWRGRCRTRHPYPTHRILGAARRCLPGCQLGRRTRGGLLHHAFRWTAAMDAARMAGSAGQPPGRTRCGCAPDALCIRARTRCDDRPRAQRPGEGNTGFCPCVGASLFAWAGGVVVANSSWSGGKAIRRSVMADYAGANPSYALWSTHGKTPDLHNELRKRLPTLHCESREKGRTKAEVDQVISWLTGYGQKQLETQLEK